MARIADVIKVIETFAPLSLAEEFDNCGLKIGDPNKTLTGVLVTVDTDIEVVNEAKSKGCNLIVEHHPSIWRPLKSIDLSVPLNNMLISAAKNDIAVYSAHTNVDYADGGLNDCVAEKIGLTNVGYISKNSSARIGDLAEETTLAVFARKLAEIFDDDNITTIGSPNKKIRKVAVINGGGGGNAEFLWETYGSGADIFVTAEVKHSVARLAKALDYAIIQFGHYASEAEFKRLMKSVLKKAMPSVKVEEAESIGDPFNKRGEIWN